MLAPSDAANILMHVFDAVLASAVVCLRHSKVGRAKKFLEEHSLKLSGFLLVAGSEEAADFVTKRDVREGNTTVADMQTMIHAIDDMLENKESTKEGAVELLERSKKDSDAVIAITDRLRGDALRSPSRLMDRFSNLKL